MRDLAELYPDSVHVTAVNLAGASDDAVWQYAAARLYVLVTKDEDFLRHARFHGVAGATSLAERLVPCATLAA